MRAFGFLLLFFCLLAGFAWAQTATLSGTIRDDKGRGLPNAAVAIKGQRVSTQSDSTGAYSLSVAPGRYTLIVRLLGYEPYSRPVSLVANEKQQISVRLTPLPLQTQEIELGARNERREQAGLIVLDPRPAKYLPNPTGDFSRYLATLPGVVANNELSSTYSVRGGNYDENLVYVNDIEIYRPFLVRSGQQEGLSFVNSDLVQGVEFSTGGFQARYGDKMSSVLNVTYKTPTRNSGGFTAGVLYQAAHAEVISNDKRFTVVAGVRRKTIRYLFEEAGLFKGLDVQGEYQPRFTDFQTYATYNLTSKKDSAAGRSLTLGLLGSFARNRYQVRPTTRETDFGTISTKLRLYVAFEGQEQMYYDTWQTGLRASRKWSKRLRTDLTFSGVRTSEREKIDVEGGYRLSDVETDFSSDNFNQSVSNRGVGTLYNYARNDLDATVYNVLNRNYLTLSPTSRMEFGFNAAAERVVDNLYEYEFVDSADYVRVTEFTKSLNTLQSYRLGGYWQHTLQPTSRSSLTYGSRISSWTYTGQVFASPRVQYSVEADSAGNWVLRFAAGVYQQPAFYREMRDFDGKLNNKIKAQRSLHLIGGMDRALRFWNRPFRLTTEVYYKAMDRIIPYDVDNVRLRYYARNAGKAYATGVDARISGEFIKGAESWFSLGVMQTKEDVDFDSKGYIRRPTDQRITLAIFFQDHLPNNPSVRGYLNLVMGTGLPFGPPRNTENRATFGGPAYRRVDLGFSKVLSVDGDGRVGKYFDSIWLGLEILNFLGAANTISYTWIKDVNDTQFAVPNTLSQRFLNAKVIATF